MRLIRKWFEKLGCSYCQDRIKELEKELVHWKHMALEFKKPHH